MRIAYTCHDAFPSSDTNTHQIFWTIFELARLGVEVDLFVPPGRTGESQPAGKVADFYGVRPEALPAGFQITTLGQSSAEHSSSKGWFDWRIPERIPTRSHDLVWSRDAVAVWSCLRAGREVIFETYRPDFATRPLFSIWRSRCLDRPNLRAVITHSRLTAAAFVAAGVPETRCLVAHNGFAPSLMTPALDRAAARSRVDLPIDGPLIVYAGHVGPEKGTASLIEMAAAIPGARFVLVGVDPGSPDACWIEAQARRLGAANLLLRPRVRVADVAPYLYAADCLIIPPTDEPLRRFGRTVLPMKVFSYLAAGRPILAPRLPDIEEVLTDGETARLVQPGNPPAAAHALADLLEDSSLQDCLSRNALALSRRYTWSERAARIVRFLEQPTT